MDYIQLFKELRLLKTSKEKSANKFRVSANELVGDLKFLAMVNQNYTTENFVKDAFANKNKKVTASDKTTMPAGQLGGMILCATNLAPGLWIHHGKSQREFLSLSAPVPIIPYACRLHKGTKYSSWVDKDETWLGPQFRGIQKARQALLYQIKELEIKQTRYNKIEKLKEEMEAEMANSETTEGESIIRFQYEEQIRAEIDDFESSKDLALLYPPERVQHLRYEFTNQGTRNINTHIVKQTGDLKFDQLPKCVRYMILQSWLLNIENRKEAMILDPINWDNVPDSIDEVTVSSSDNYWEDLL